MYSNCRILFKLWLTHHFDDESNTLGQLFDVDVCHMKELRILMCSGFVNALSSLPKGICWFRHMNQTKVCMAFPIIPQSNDLIILDFRHSELCSVLESYGELSSLEVLDLSNCWNLTMLPRSFGGLQKMREFKLDGSRIESLPESFGELSRLEVLDLSSCSNLTMLPRSFGSLQKMR